MTNTHTPQTEDAEFADEPTPHKPPSGLWGGSMPLGSVTSPSSSSEYKMVLRDYAANAQVEYSLVCLDYTEYDPTGAAILKTVLCQATGMQLKNTHHENPLLRALVRERGRIPGLSGFADHKEVDLLPLDSVIRENRQHQLPGNIPPTGTEVRFASEEDVKLFSGDTPTLFNIGTLYGTTSSVGLTLKHFGEGEDGWGEAKMLGVFGATGSGKSVMAASILGGYAAHPNMGMLIVDPQGQFSGYELGKDSWSWRLDKAFARAGRTSQTARKVHIEEIGLESLVLFADLLAEYGFFDAFSIKSLEKKEQISAQLPDHFSQFLKDNKLSISQYTWDDYHNDIIPTIIRVGSAEYANRTQIQGRMQDAINENTQRAKARRAWEKVREMFSRPYKLSQLLDDVLIHHDVIILNIDTPSDTLKELFAFEVLSGIKKKAEMIYRIKLGTPYAGDNVKKYRDAKINALIVIDEAQRLAPEGGRGAGSERDQRMISTLSDAIRTTRKLNVGWCYITQSIAEFSKSIFRQIQTKVIGIGLGTGADKDHLETAFNGDKGVIRLYQSLPRPATTGVYPYAIVGELVALGNGTKPIFISAFASQHELIAHNPTHFYTQEDTLPQTEQSISYESSNDQDIDPDF